MVQTRVRNDVSNCMAIRSYNEAHAVLRTKYVARHSGARFLAAPCTTLPFCIITFARFALNFGGRFSLGLTIGKPGWFAYRYVYYTMFNNDWVNQNVQILSCCTLT